MEVCRTFADDPPFDFFIQSPIGLVPKDGGEDTRLIFHLSYPRNGLSVNSEHPKEYCSVQYLTSLRLCRNVLQKFKCMEDV